MSDKNLTAFLTIRITNEMRDAFVEKSRLFGRPSEVHRELVEAFVDDRITIKANPKKPTMEKLYND